MTRDEVVALIKGRVARSGNTDITDYVISELKFTQSVLEEAPELPWFLITEYEHTTWLANEERVSVPTSFLLEYEEGTLWLLQDDGTYVPVIKADYDEISELTETVKGSYVYALAGDYFRIRPTSTVNKTIRMIYYANDTALSTNIENGWLKHAPDLMIAMTGVNVAKYLKDYEAMTAFMRDIEPARDRLRRKMEARKHTNVEYSMGDD